MRTEPVTAAVHAATRERGLYGVACSGGADSIALADAAIRVAGAANVVIVTVDHGLAAGSSEIAARVATWAMGQGAAAVVRRVVVERRSEASARTARYAAFTAAIEELGLAAMLLGHTARDQAETVLMRVLRGTGPAGLAGIPARRGPFIRPLLALPRAAIDAYVAARDLPIWEDPMNDDPAFARVRMRAQLLPVLRAENPQLDAALVRLADSTAEWLAVIDALADPYARFPIACPALAAQPAAIRKRAIARALDAAGLGHDSAATVDDLDRLVTRPTSGERSIDVSGGTVVRSYETLDVRSVNGSTTALCEVTGHALRAWRAGDRMRPVRLRGRTRKLSDLYGDAKVPRAVRATARVLERLSDGRIVWAEHLGMAFGEPADLEPKPVQTAGTF